MLNNDLIQEKGNSIFAEMFTLIFFRGSTSLSRIILLGPFSINKNFFTVFLVFAFLTKFPIFGVHLWLPKAHVEAPVSGSMILAGILLKLGRYGIVRLSFFMEPSSVFRGLVIISLTGRVILGIVCVITRDIKVVIAYSSVVHMALIISGVFSMGTWGVEGGIIVMVAHGVCSSGIFIGANILYERSHSRRYFFNGRNLRFSP